MLDQLIEVFRRAFGRAPAVVGQAPGRVEFIGNHTDYNGGAVLGAAIDRFVWVGVAPRSDFRIRLHSPSRSQPVEADARALEPRTGEEIWANYPLGVYRSLRSRGLGPVTGYDLAVHSNVPSGAGVSSSAALELATAVALTGLDGRRPPARELAIVAREAENTFVGVPCGILDQGVSAYGGRDRLVHIDCLTIEFSTVPVPAGTRFWLFNTHQKHSLVTSLYSARHAECQAAWAEVQREDPGLPCLARASLAHLEAAAPRLPETAVKRARHVIEEHQRVAGVVAAFARGDLEEGGRLMVASHRSSQLLFENSTPYLDFLVDRLEGHPRVHGCRLTGGGFGGAVMALTTEGFGELDARGVAEAYAARWGAPVAILDAATAPGALQVLPEATASLGA